MTRIYKTLMILSALLVFAPPIFAGYNDHTSYDNSYDHNYYPSQYHYYGDRYYNDAYVPISTYTRVLKNKGYTATEATRIVESYLERLRYQDLSTSEMKRDLSDYVNDFSSIKKKKTSISTTRYVNILKNKGYSSSESNRLVEDYLDYLMYDGYRSTSEIKDLLEDYVDGFYAQRSAQNVDTKSYVVRLQRKGYSSSEAERMVNIRLYSLRDQGYTATKIKRELFEYVTDIPNRKYNNNYTGYYYSDYGYRYQNSYSQTSINTNIYVNILKDKGYSTTRARDVVNDYLKDIQSRGYTDDELKIYLSAYVRGLDSDGRNVAFVDTETYIDILEDKGYSQSDATRLVKKRLEYLRDSQYSTTDIKIYLAAYVNDLAWKTSSNYESQADTGYIDLTNYIAQVRGKGYTQTIAENLVKNQLIILKRAQFPESDIRKHLSTYVSNLAIKKKTYKNHLIY